MFNPELMRSNQDSFIRFKEYVELAGNLSYRFQRQTTIDDSYYDEEATDYAHKLLIDEEKICAGLILFNFAKDVTNTQVQNFVKYKEYYQVDFSGYAQELIEDLALIYQSKQGCLHHVKFVGKHSLENLIHYLSDNIISQIITGVYDPLHPSEANKILRTMTFKDAREQHQKIISQFHKRLENPRETRFIINRTPSLFVGQLNFVDVGEANELFANYISQQMIEKVLDVKKSQ